VVCSCTGALLMNDHDATECSVRAARDRYLARNGFSTASYEAPWIEVALWGLSVPTPNTRHRQWALRVHDLHHVATQFGTDLTGEGELSAWELARGLRGLGLYVGAIVLSATLLGLLVAPRRTLHAFVRGRHSTASLYRSPRSYDQLLAMSVLELRRELGLPPAGLAQGPQGVHGNAPRTSALSC
jgi:hypothetical protein